MDICTVHCFLHAELMAMSKLIRQPKKVAPACAPLQPCGILVRPRYSTYVASVAWNRVD